MAYLIARKRESHGCLALKIKHGGKFGRIEEKIKSGCRI